jgi:hypothetical protein
VCSDSEGSSPRERISIGGVPIAPAARIRTLHSISSLPRGWREGLGPSLSISDAVTTYR